MTFPLRESHLPQPRVYLFLDQNRKFMRQLFPVMVCLAILSCTQQATPTKNNSSEGNNSTLSKKQQFLIDVSNLAWYQVQVAKMALTKTHATALLNIAQKMTKDYVRIKDRAKIVSIPYNTPMPYFNTHDQNTRVKELKTSADSTFKKEFISQIKENDQLILKQCESVQEEIKNENDFEQLVNLSVAVVENNQSNLGKLGF